MPINYGQFAFFRNGIVNSKFKSIVTLKVNPVKINTLWLMLTLAMWLFFFEILNGYTQITLIKIILILELFILSFFLKYNNSRYLSYINPQNLIAVGIYIWHFLFITINYLFPFSIFENPGGILNYEDYLINKSILYASFCLNFFIFGSLINIKINKKQINKIKKFSNQIGEKLVIVFLIIILIFLYTENRLFSDITYLETYFKKSESIIYRLYYSTQFLVPLFILMWGYNNHNKRDLIKFFILGFMLVLLALFNGDRSLPFIIIVSYFIIIDNFLYKFNAIKLILLLMVMSIFSWSFILIRSGSNLIDLFNFDNINIFHMFWEMGRTLGVVTDTIFFVDNSEFHYGSSYARSLLELIPIITNKIEFIYNIPRPSEWLIENLNNLKEGQGYGFSIIAEAYYNFGWLGSFLFIALGYSINYLYSKYVISGLPIYYLASYFPSVLLLLHARNDSGSYLRVLLWGLLISYIASFKFCKKPKGEVIEF